MRKIVAQESQLIVLGHWAENEAACVEFDITGWEDRYGAGGHFDVLAKRQGDSDYYPCQTQREGNKVLWFISSADTAVMGQGSCGLVYHVGDVVAKSVIFTTVVTEGVTNGGEFPEPWEDWTNSVLQAGAGIQQSAIDAAIQAAAAAGSAASAAGSASTATTKASEASSSAADANTAKVAAQAAQGAAETASTTAQGAATTATQQATAAAGSAADALNYKTAAETEKTAAEAAQEAAETAQEAAEAAQEAAEAAAVESVRFTAQSLTDEQQQQARDNIGLGNVDNTADANKPVSTAQQTALNLKADKTALSRTNRSLDYLWKKSEGIIYDTETVHSDANTVTVPSGAMEYASMDKIGGKSIVFNQLMKNGNFASGTVGWWPNNATISVSDNVLSITATNRWGYVNVEFNGIAKTGHKYYLSAKCKLSSVGDFFRIGLGSPASFSSQGVFTTSSGVGTSDFSRMDCIGTYTGESESAWLVIMDWRADGWDTCYFKDVMLFDLTQMFGAGNEPSTVEELRTMFPNDYYPYTVGTLISAPVDKVVSKKADTTTLTERTIPQSVIALCPDYGQGTAESFNYIDFVGKKYYHKGSMGSDGVWTELAAEEIIDLSAAIPEDFEILPVEAGGTIQFHYPELDNGYSLDVSNDMTYMVNVAEVTA